MRKLCVNKTGFKRFISKEKLEDGQGVSGWNMPGCKEQIRSGRNEVKYLAHINDKGEEQPLKEHLENTAQALRSVRRKIWRL